MQDGKRYFISLGCLKGQFVKLSRLEFVQKPFVRFVVRWRWKAERSFWGLLESFFFNLTCRKCDLPAVTECTIFPFWKWAVPVCVHNTTLGFSSWAHRQAHLPFLPFLGCQSTWTGCLEKLWCLYLWRHSKPAWMCSEWFTVGDSALAEELD